MQEIVGFDSETVLTKEGKYLTHKFYSAQFYSEIPIFKGKNFLFTQNPFEVQAIFSKTNRGRIFLALNAEFDFCVLAKILRTEPLKLKCLYNKSRFLYGKILKNRSAYKIYDLMNIFNGWSLKKLGEFLGLPKLEKPPYLGERAPKTDQEKIYFKSYAMRDAEICYLAGKWLIAKFGKVTVSAPSLAFWYFNNKYKPYGLYYSAVDPLKSKLRLAYKGGRCEAFIRGSIPETIYAYDKISLYPSVMLDNYFPMGFYGFEQQDEINFRNEGLAYCTVKSDLELPFLCIKHLCADKNVKLVFPNGTFKGWFTYPELRFFKHELKQEILTVHECYETSKSKKYFKEYIEEFFELKNADKEHASFWKLFMNSLYGKFAQDAHSPELIITDKGEIVIGKQKPSKKINFKTNILVSAYIAAYARIDMYRTMKKVGVENLVYTDTDSIHTLKPIKEIGVNLGDLAFICEGKGMYIRSKFYILNDMVKCRGMEHIFSAENVRKLIEKDDVECMGRTLLRLRAAFRQHKPFLTQQDTSKHFSTKTDCKRTYTKVLNGAELLSNYTLSKPLILEEKENGFIA